MIQFHRFASMLVKIQSEIPLQLNGAIQKAYLSSAHRMVHVTQKHNTEMSEPTIRL